MKTTIITVLAISVVASAGYGRTRVSAADKEREEKVAAAKARAAAIAAEQEQRNEDAIWRWKQRQKADSGSTIVDGEATDLSVHNTSFNDLDSSTTIYTPPKPDVPAPVNSPWDGSVKQVKKYLKDNLDDPYSIRYVEWSRVIEWDRGYAVRCKYRTKTVFGGYKLYDHVFVMDWYGAVVAVGNFQELQGYW